VGLVRLKNPVLVLEDIVQDTLVLGAGKRLGKCFSYSDSESKSPSTP